MQTEYKLLYRFVNGTTNTPITDEAPYEKTEEFYSSEHKVNLTETKLNNQYRNFDLRYNTPTASSSASEYAAMMNKEANEAREALVTSNMANENKSNNLYVYTGTTKQFHKKFIPEAVGYVVRDWTQVPINQLPDGPDDYSKHFVMLGGQKLGVDDAYLVCKPQYMSLYSKTWQFTITSNSGATNTNFDNVAYYDRHSKIENFTELVNKKNWFQWLDPFIAEDDQPSLDYGETKFTDTTICKVNIQTALNGTRMVTTKVVPQNNGTPQVTNYIFFANHPFNLPGTSSSLTNTVTFVQTQNDQNTRYGVERNQLEANLGNDVGGARVATNETQILYANEIVFSKACIKRDIIPEHYEDTGKPPYIIKDQYEKIELSPWMLHSIHHSLESGLEMAKKLVGMLGIDNVKLIKNVPIDQFVKIK